MKRVLFGTGSWGLGHATRDLALLRGLLAQGCELTVISTGTALAVLQRELGASCHYLDWPDIPTSVAPTSLGFYMKTIAHIPQILGTWFEERRRLAQFLSEERFDLVISDHRNGLITRRVPCYFITHSPRYIAPWRDPFMEATMEFFLARWFAPVRKVLIPDDAGDGLSGDMSHKIRFTPPGKLVYLGILSSLRRCQHPQDIDYFITLSGPEPQRTLLQKAIFSQLSALQGHRTVIALGQPGGSVPPGCSEHVRIYPYLDRAGQEEMMNRSKLVICRSGYTTLMELAELGKRALLIPTPGQSEQLYLAKTLRRRGLFHSVRQDELDLARDLPLAMNCPGYQPKHLTVTSVERFVETVLS
jgi:UDP:flavonoid glycosyltransferase YjiC (YdhE family)